MSQSLTKNVNEPISSTITKLFPVSSGTKHRLVQSDKNELDTKIYATEADKKSEDVVKNFLFK
jgi:hypothetical protein